MVPALQPLIGPTRHRQPLVGWGQVLVTQSQPRRHQMPHQVPVERVAGQRHAVGAQDVRRPASAVAHARAHGDYGEVARAAAEVADQDALVAREPGLVRVGRSDGLVFEGKLVEPRQAEGVTQPTLGKRVEVDVGRQREVHRPAEHRASRGRPRKMIADVLPKQRDEPLEPEVFRADDGALEATVRQVRLQRLDESTLVLGGQVALDRGPAGRCRLSRLEVQHRGEGRARTVGARER